MPKHKMCPELSGSDGEKGSRITTCSLLPGWQEKLGLQVSCWAQLGDRLCPCWVPPTGLHGLGSLPLHGALVTSGSPGGAFMPQYLLGLGNSQSQPPGSSPYYQLHQMGPLIHSAKPWARPPVWSGCEVVGVGLKVRDCDYMAVPPTVPMVPSEVWGLQHLPGATPYGPAWLPLPRDKPSCSWSQAVSKPPSPLAQPPCVPCQPRLTHTVLALCQDPLPALT